MISAGKRLWDKFISKNQARQLIENLRIRPNDLEKEVGQIHLKLYDFIAENLKNQRWVFL